MPLTAPKKSSLTLLFGWQRILFTLLTALLLSLLISLVWQSSTLSLIVRVVAVALLSMLVFGAFEQWPRRLPGWFARWVLQVLGVALTIPISLFAIWHWSTAAGAPPFWQDMERLGGFAILSIVGILVAPWVALAALLRQKEAFARHQALAFDLERSELERQALDARLHLLQAQVAPHFLFNTLANVQALVDTGSPHASRVLDSLIAYLRAAVPRLDQDYTTLDQELQLVRAYLDLMHMRMPDRLQFSLRIDPALHNVLCPPMTLLTLVENAVKHGIDPSEEGGHIEISAQQNLGRCFLQVSDTGVGLPQSGQGNSLVSNGLGTGLLTLRERLALAFGGNALLRLTAVQPHGTCVEIEFPIEISAAHARLDNIQAIRA